ncbi:MAG: ABC transporter permease [Phycisphaeraceae bacterium]
MMPRWWHRFWPPVLVFVLFGVGLEAWVRLAHIESWLVPPPSSILATLWHRWRYPLGPALWQTTLAAVLGFAASAAAGVILAVVLASARIVQRAFYPYAIFFQTVPIIAIAPLLVIWIGYGLSTVVASAFIVSLFPVIANTLMGLRSTDPALRDLFRLHGAGAWATLWKLRLPWAMPHLFAGLRVSAGLAVIGAIVGEFFVGQGLGMQIFSAQKTVHTEVVYAAILLASLLGLALFGLVNLAAALTLRHWHASEQGG